MFLYVAHALSANVANCKSFEELGNTAEKLNFTVGEQRCFNFKKSYFFFTPNNFSIDIEIPIINKESGDITYERLDKEQHKPLGFLNANNEHHSHAAISVPSNSTVIYAVPVDPSNNNVTQFFTTVKKLKREYRVDNNGVKINSFVFNYYNQEKSAFVVKNTGTVALNISKNGVVKSSIEQNGIKNFKFTGQVGIIPVFSGVESSDVEIEVKTLGRPKFIPDVEMIMTGPTRFIQYKKTHKISDSRDAIIGSSACLVIIVFYFCLYFFCCRNEDKKVAKAEQSWVMM